MCLAFGVGPTMIPAYRLHRVRCFACAVPDVTATCPRCLVALCEAHAPEDDRRCGACEAEWVFGQVERGAWREEVAQPLGFAVGVSALVVAGVVSSWLFLCVAAVVLAMGIWTPRAEADAHRRAFLREKLERTR